MAARGLVVVEGASHNNPACVHGPTVLFERFLSDGSTRRFYACAACRDRKDCAFFLWADQTMSRSKRKLWARLCREKRPKLTHQERYSKLASVKGVAASERAYCNSCSELLVKAETDSHKSCSLTTPVTDAQLAHPSTLLPPKENAKLEAQYLFSACSVEVLLSLLGCLEASGVLCVGAPRVHETITSALNPAMSSLMLDIDDRYCSFLPSESFLQYNMFNHHFFGGTEAQETYRSFLAKHEKLVLFSDPPFGGRMELLAATLGRIESDWRAARSLGPNATLPVLFVFPYFLEAQVVASMPTLAMMDYQVDYDNHPVYGKGPRGMKHGSAVRIFTNQPLESLPLPSEEGYRWCEPCRRWVNAANTHCDLCRACTSKDGRTYKHCHECGHCVKPSWTHCQACAACRPPEHSCSPPPLGCYTCGSPDHKHLTCPKRKRPATSTGDSKKKKKRKNNKTGALPSSLADERQRNLQILSQVMETNTERMMLDDDGALFGDQQAERIGDSDSEGRSEGEEEHQERESGREEVEEQNGNEAAAAAAGAGTGKTIKANLVKRPQLKLDAHRLAGPRGMFALKKTFRNFKFKGNGHEREDLRAMLQVLEHWAHRMYPKLPFRDTLEQIEKLGTQKSVQVNLKKIRLDMFTEEGEGEGEDNVRRGTDDDATEPQVPTVDVFDELLGIATTNITTTTTAATTNASTLLPRSPPKPATPSQSTTMTDAQRERMERNRRLAIEKRLARQQQQQQQQQQQRESDSVSQNNLDNSLEPQEERLPNCSVEVMDAADDVLNKLKEQEETRETQENLEEALPIDDVLEKIQDTVRAQENKTPEKTGKRMDTTDNVLDMLKEQEERRETQENSEEELAIEDVLGKIQDPILTQESKTQGNTVECMDVADDVSNNLEKREERRETQKDSEELTIEDVLEKIQDPVTIQERKTCGNTEDCMDVTDDVSQA